MFNLIVSGSGWKRNRDTFPRERIVEFTSDALKATFTTDGRIDLERISRLPTLFLSETGAPGDEAGHVGNITRIREAGKDIELDYVFEADIAPIAGASIERLANELGIGQWEFTRTHWAIKDVDLFYALLRLGEPKTSPKVFQLALDPVDEKLVSVMMPFDAAFDSVYAAIVSSAKSLGKRCRRADDIWKHDVVIQDIVSLLCTSSVVICDLSRKNANVFYEVGIAHTLGKDVILITQSSDDVPFNLRHLRFINYLNNGEGREKLGEALEKRIRALDTER